MASEYVTLMQTYKRVLNEGDREKAEKIFDKAQKLVEAGKVSEDELVAGAYC